MLTTQQPVFRRFWHAVMPLSDLQDGPRPFTLLGESIVVFLDEHGQPAALRDRWATREARKAVLDLADLRDAPLIGLSASIMAAFAFVSIREMSDTEPVYRIVFYFSMGGVVAGKAISAKELKALADLPPREVMLAQLAGMLQAPLTKTANMFAALPRKTAYALKALVEQREAA